MKSLKQIIFFVIFGVATTLYVVYFYNVQKEFSYKHKEFLTNFNNLKACYNNSTNLILKNSLYVFSNQDQIAISNNELNNDYLKLKNSKILSDSNYENIRRNIEKLEKQVSTHIEEIEYFLRINAGIKNSLLFLNRHIEKGDLLREHEPKTLLKAANILKEFHNVKNFHDITYMPKEHTVKSSIKNKEIQYYIDNFNLHAQYLFKEYPVFIEETKKILNNKNIKNRLSQIGEEFSKVSINDTKSLNNLAYMLFFIFILYFFMILSLLLKIKKENIKLTKTSQELEYSLSYDQLTGLKNRISYEKEIRTISNPTILLININSFKNINDIYGIEFGNKTLKKFSSFIANNKNIKDSSKIYRVDGDEFVIVLNNPKSGEEYELANFIENEVSKHNFQTDGIDVFLKIGVAICDESPLLENAGLTLEKIKKTHHIDVYKYKEEDYSKQDVAENMKIVQTIKKALEEDRIIPFYQPIVNLKNSKIEKYEALVRLKLEDDTYLPPYKFLDISKKSSLYYKITSAMIKQVLNTAKDYKKYRFSINLSMIDIKNDKIKDEIFSLFDANKDAASRIDIEFLESEHLEDMELIASFIDKAREYGCKILIDDFGTGYSNFSYFSSLKVDILKVDGSIVSKINSDPTMLHMFKSIKEFANGMGMLTVSEFVENQEIAQKLQELGAAYAQGYYFSKPLEKPLDDDNVII